MRQKNVTLSYKKMGYAQFLNKVREIQAGLTNPVFLTVTPTPADVQPHLDELQDLVTEVDRSNYSLIPARNNVRATITELLGKQGQAVNLIADGDEAVLKLSGFDYTKDPVRSTVPTKGEALRTKILGAGSIEFNSRGIRHADFLEFELDGPGDFCKKYYQKRSKLVLHELPVGVQIKATVRGSNSHGDGPWSDSVTFVLYGSSQHNNNAAV
jgi:hypothetical protein